MLRRGVFITQGTIILFLIAALILLTLSKRSHDIPSQVDFHDLDPWTEFKHWLTLSRVIWPILIISLVLGFVDSTFYTVGTVWTVKLASINPWGIWFLPLYLLPAICLGIPLSELIISGGKKKLTEKFLGLTGIIFIMIALSDSVAWQLAIVGLASCAMAVCYPLLGGVYSDVIARMGKGKKDMIGLTSSVGNLSYIIWPVFAGIIASKVGERLTFSWLGAGVLAVAVILLLVTPKKLKLPQSRMRDWETRYKQPLTQGQ
jgi:MFS family permease